MLQSYISLSIVCQLIYGQTCLRENLDLGKRARSDWVAILAINVSCMVIMPSGGLPNKSGRVVLDPDNPTLLHCSTRPKCEISGHLLLT